MPRWPRRSASVPAWGSDLASPLRVMSRMACPDGWCRHYRCEASRYNEAMAYEEILGEGGAIARKLGNYEVRPQQLAMAEAVARAIGQRQHLLVEAGTGVGKSFAYLVPAIQAALADPECRVIISTHTISLQEQLLRKDLPFLQTVMPKPFRAMLVKGRGNYLSLRRLQT